MTPLNMTEYTPVHPRAGGLVHATSFDAPTRTVCGRKCSGWAVAFKPLGCMKCKATVHLPVKLNP